MDRRFHSSRQRYRRYLEAQRARRKADKAALSSRTTVTDPGVAVLLSPEEDRSKQRRQRSFVALLVAFWGMLRGHQATILVALATVTGATLLNLLQPASTKIAIDYIITDNPGPSGLPAWLVGPGGLLGEADRLGLLLWLGAGLIALATAGVAVGMWGRWQMTRITKRVQTDMRKRVFEHAVRLPLHRVYQIKSGGVASILREDAGGAGEMVFSLLYNPWRAIIQLIGTLIVLAWTDWRMLLGGLLLIPAVWISHRTWIARIRPVFRDIRHNRTAIDAHATEAFGGMRVVRGFNRHRGEAGRFTRSSHLMARQEIWVWWWSRIIDILWSLLIPFASVAVLIYGGRQVINGSLTIGDVMMFSAYLLMLLSPLDVLANTATTIQNNLAGFDRVLDLLGEPTELTGGGGGAGAVGTVSLNGTAGGVRAGAAPSPDAGLIEVSPATALARITLSNVSFSYPGHTERVLRHVDLDVLPGQTVALVGPSGSGKTTLCNLVARFYDPTEGAILLDGVDLRAIRVDSYRSLLGVVEQDVFLFDGTVAENVGYARRDASPEEVGEAARAANADGFIDKLERGYATLIGERGVRLSGGQKQRIAIARALLARPRILILDEATSNLDSESEALIQASLRTLMRGRTCFVIAHRLSTIRHADRIVVLEGGRVLETGTHEELLAREGRYWEMLQVQLHQPDEQERERAKAAAVAGAGAGVGDGARTP